MTTSARIDYCGEQYDIPEGRALTIGREGDVAIDDNPFLHRHFLELRLNDALLWIANVGSSLSATLSDSEGRLQAYLAPGAQLPVVFPQACVWFTAGPTTYEFDIYVETPVFVPVLRSDLQPGGTTVGRIAMTPDQTLLMVALSEDVLRRGHRGAGSVPSSADAARRLGWTITKFNRKLDNVCEKLTALGIRGLHGGPDKMATSRRARLVEYAVSGRIVTVDDLPLLDAGDSTHLD